MDQLTCPISPDERALVEALKRRLDETPDANVVRLGLWSLCVYLGIHLPTGTFELDRPITKSLPDV